MRKDDVRVLQGVQKNTDMAIKAIHAITPRVYDDDLALQIARQGMKYSEINNKATAKLIEAKAESYKSTGFQDMMLHSAVKGNTMFNTSTSHIAELMIQGSNRGLTDMWKTINHHENAGNMTMEIAKELMDFEEKNIERLKKYL
ncbi:MAG: hypothetical protein J6J79_04535 [Lachnospiraceae bacterium]|nr:hypothetical protein [Lachnospiraceae bacterium]